MTSRYLEGVALLVVTVAPIVLGAIRLRRQLLPAWSGAPAAMVDITIAVTMLLLVGQVLGVLGALRLAPFAVTCVAAGVGTAFLSARARPMERSEPPPPPRVSRLAIVVAFAAGALVLAAWSARVATAFDIGITSADSLWQHLPAAARFAQEGSIRDLQYFDSEPFTVFYPLHSSLLHAEGMVLFGTDVLSPLLNVGWFAFALLAAWCLGRPVGVGPACVVGVALVLSSPVLVTTHAGGAYNDVMVIALVVAALGILANGGTRPVPVALAGVAAGLAVGTKFTPIPTVAALTVATLALAPRGTRGKVAATWLVAVVLAGGFWYARNLVRTGSPLPPFNLDLGFFALPTVHDQTIPRETVAQYITDSQIRRALIEPAVESNFGPVWEAILAFAGVGMVVSLFSREGFARLLGFVGIASVAAYLYTPLILGTKGFPYLFKSNIRYVTLAVAIGLVALARHPGLRRATPQWLLLMSLSVLLVVTQTDDQIWQIGHKEVAVGAAAAALVAVGVLVWFQRPRPLRRVAIAVAAALAVAVVWAGAGVQHDYLRDRYTTAAALRFKLAPMGGYWEWAQGMHHARIAMLGDILTYPLYGRDLTNRVEYIGHHGPHGRFSAIVTCQEWRRTINDGKYGYVITTPPGAAQESPPAEGWTRSDPAATQIESNPIAEGGHAALFRLSGPLHPESCPRPPRALITRGRGQVIRLPSATEIPVRPGAIAGVVEVVKGTSNGVTVSGWATDPRARRPAQRILVLENGRRLASGSPTGPRPDIAERFGPSASRSGFNLTIIDPRGARLAEPGTLEVYATANGRASKLPPLP